MFKQISSVAATLPSTVYNNATQELTPHTPKISVVIYRRMVSGTQPAVGDERLRRLAGS